MIYWLAFGALAGTGVLLTGLLLGHLTAKTNPVLRSSILVGSAGLSLVLPALAYFLKKFQWQVEVPVSASVGSPVTTTGSLAWESPAILFWCAGTLYLLARFGVCLLKTRALVGRAAGVLDQRVWEASKGLRRRKASILESGEITSPVVVGFLRLSILFPIGLIQRLDDVELRAVLAHEFSHVAHGHTRIGLLMALVKALYWPNPLIHILSRQVFRAFEEAADAETLEQVSSRDFSRALLNLATGHHLKSPELGLSILSHRAGLEERLRLLSDPARKATMKKHTFRLVGSLSALAIASVLTAAVRVARDSDVQEPMPEPEVNIVQVTPDASAPPAGSVAIDESPEENVIVEIPMAPEAPPKPEEFYGVLVEVTPEAKAVEGVLVEVVETTPLAQSPKAPAPPLRPSRASAPPAIAPKPQKVSAAPTPVAKASAVSVKPSEAPRATMSTAPKAVPPVIREEVRASEAPSKVAAPEPREPAHTVTPVIAESPDGDQVPLVKGVPLLKGVAKGPLLQNKGVPLLSDIPLLGPRVQEPLLKRQGKVLRSANIPILSNVPIIGLLPRERSQPSNNPRKREEPAPKPAPASS